MKSTIICSLMAISLIACKKEEALAPETCGSVRTTVSTSVEIDSAAFTSAPNLTYHGQPEARIHGDTLYAQFRWAAAYGGHVRLVADTSFLDTEFIGSDRQPAIVRVRVRAVFDEYPPYCIDHNIVINGSWDLSAIKALYPENRILVQLGETQLTY